jgi:predicted nucleic acid-binding protein
MKCLDTYALVEIHDQNPKFLSLLQEDIVITDITMAEFYTVLYREYGNLTADHWDRKLHHFCRPVNKEILIKAVKLRVDSRQKNLSFFDSVGYTFACEHNMDFVTADEQFEKMKNVLFLKK